MALDDDFQGNNNYRLSAELRMTGRNQFGGEWRTRLDLGKETGLRSEFYQPYGARSQFYVRPSIDLRTTLRRVANDDQLLGILPNQPDDRSDYLGEFRQRTYSAGVETGFDFTANQRLRAEVVRSRDYANVQIGSIAVPERSDALRLGLGYLYDSLDDAAFPRRR